MYNYLKTLVRCGNLICASLKAVINTHNNFKNQCYIAQPQLSGDI